MTDLQSRALAVLANGPRRSGELYRLIWPNSGVASERRTTKILTRYLAKLIRLGQIEVVDGYWLLVAKASARKP